MKSKILKSLSIVILIVCLWINISNAAVNVNESDMALDIGLNYIGERIQYVNGILTYINYYGEPDYGFTGIESDSYGTIWYIENGIVNFEFNGIYQSDCYDLYIIRNGKVQRDVTALMKYKNTWTYFENGISNYGYNGFASNENGTWYVENGIVTFNYNDTIFYGDNAYIVINSKLVTALKSYEYKLVKINGIWKMVVKGYIDEKYNGLGVNSNGLWVVQNGRVNFDFNGIFTDEYGAKWYAENGKVREDICEIIKIDGVWTYVQDGEVRYDYTGIASNKNGTWYVENGIVTFNYNDTICNIDDVYVISNSKLVDIISPYEYKVVKINGIWKMVVKGHIDENYNGLGVNENGLWAVQGGVVNFDVNGVFTDVYGGKWYVENSKVRQDINEIIKIDGIWTYVQDGEVRYDYTGIASNKNGTWLVENGIVTFGFTGIYNERDISYSITNSKVSFSFYQSFRNHLRSWKIF